MNKFKNWKIVALILLVLFALNKCTQSCNRANKIDKLSKEIVTKDSIIEVKENQVKALVRDTTDYANQSLVSKLMNIYDKEILLIL